MKNPTRGRLALVEVGGRVERRAVEAHSYPLLNSAGRACYPL